MSPNRSRHLFRGVLTAGAFAALAVAWTFPLVFHLSTHLLGSGAGDNVEFVWNFWWMRTALKDGLDVFRTPFLFAPMGADLTLHTHTALPAFVGATALRSLSDIAAQDVTILAALFLNGFCAYLLACRVTRDRVAALVAGLVFGGSPYLSAHLSGHFNLVHAWVIPLFALSLSRALEGSLRWGLACGLVLGATIYIDYYYLVYEIGLGVVLCVLAIRQWSLQLRGPDPRTRWLARLLGMGIAIDILVITAIIWTGGFDIPFGSRQVPLQETYNGLQILWVLVGAWMWVRWRPHISSRPLEVPAVAPVWAPALLGTGVFLVAAAPLIWNAAGVLQRGEYVTQRYLWRSAPAGVDLGTWFLGNPYHGLFGGEVRRVYGWLGIDVVERGAWLGIAPALLSIWVIRRHWADQHVRLWTIIGGVFLIWALGPHLTLFGHTTGMILPETLVRFIPIVSNARIPGRAMVVVSLAVALLTAKAVVHWRDRSRWPAAVAAGVALLVIADYVPAPFALVAMDRPAIYEVLRARPEPGAVCELPLGLRDGFGEVGRFDARTMFNQTIHGRPMVGGFVARLPPGVLSAYRANPLMAGLLRLSSETAEGADAQPLPDGPAAAAILRRDGIRFVVLDRSTASPALTDYVEHVLPLDLVAQDGHRSLYVTK